MKTKSRHALLALCLLSSALTFAHNGEVHGDPHAGQIWPPQPQGISNINDQSETSELRLMSGISRIDTLEASALSRYKNALGSKFTRVALIDSVDETGKIINSTLVFFSHSRNTTVEFTFVNDKVKSVKSIPAGTYQPEITDEEAAEAQAIAQSYFLNKGITSVANLKAYSILAYKPEKSGFYNTRVIYVTFHDNDDSPPEYRAWVDLTRQQVIKTGEEE